MHNKTKSDDRNLLKKRKKIEGIFGLSFVLVTQIILMIAILASLFYSATKTTNYVVLSQDPSKVDVRSLGGKFKEVEINATSFANNSVTLKKIISMLIESNKDSYENLVQLINLSTVVKYVHKEN